MRRPSPSSKNVIAALVAATFGLTAGAALAQPTTTGKLNRATAQLKHTTRQMNQTREKETRVASAEHHVKKGERKQRRHVHSPSRHPANTTPPQQ